MTAFEHWFKENYEDDLIRGAEYLFDCCAKGPADSVVWEYLNEVGDKKYTQETFIKAAKLILEAKDENP